MSDEEAREDAYVPRPPLWKAKPAKRLAWPLRAALLAVGLAALALSTFPWTEQQFLSDAAPVLIEIVKVEQAAQDSEKHPLYRHSARLPDGTLADFWDGRIHTPGERLVAMGVRGRITKRLVLQSPVAGEPVE